MILNIYHSLIVAISFTLVTLEMKRVSSATRWVDVADYPFIVLVNLTNKGTYSTGTLVNPKVVLTTADCLIGEDDDSVYVYVVKEPLGAEFLPKGKLDVLHTSAFQERRSKLLIMPWAYLIDTHSPRSANFGLVDLTERFECCRLHYTPLSASMIRPFTKSDCRVIGFDVGEDFLSSKHFPGDKVLLKEVDITVMKQCHADHPGHTAGDTIVGKNPKNRAMICQIDDTWVAKSFAQSGPLLLCGNDSVFNGISIGLLNVQNTNGPVGHDVSLVFLDICPYLSWIRSMSGPEVIQSPGFYGRECFLNDINRAPKLSGLLSYAFVIINLCYK